jgi:hypothetical protein
LDEATEKVPAEASGTKGDGEKNDVAREASIEGCSVTLAQARRKAAR